MSCTRGGGCTYVPGAVLTPNEHALEALYPRKLGAITRQDFLNWKELGWDFFFLSLPLFSWRFNPLITGADKLTQLSLGEKKRL